MNTLETSVAGPVKRPGPPEEILPAAGFASASRKPADLQVTHILVPIDFSLTSEKALAYAISLAELWKARLTVLHVADITGSPIDYNLYAFNDEAYNAAAQRKLDGLIAERVAHRLEAPSPGLIRAGAPWIEICNAANELDVDLIVLTTHGYTGLKHVLLGSTAERVVRHAACPVLVVRDKVQKAA